MLSFFKDNCGRGLCEPQLTCIAYYELLKHGRRSCIASHRLYKKEKLQPPPQFSIKSTKTLII